jgi:hypothetical protein
MESTRPPVNQHSLAYIVVFSEVFKVGSQNLANTPMPPTYVADKSWSLSPLLYIFLTVLFILFNLCGLSLYD